VAGFWSLLRDNPNYRYTWMGQVVSEVGDHFNSIAVLSLALHLTGSGAAVGGVMLARTIPAIVAGFVSGVVLDRFDRRRVMIASDLARFVFAMGFVLVLTHHQRWLLYFLSGALMFASPFFTSGRAAILPRIASPEQLHTANALTQTTSWLTLSIGTLLGGFSAMSFGYEWAFVVNAISFLFSAWAIWKLKAREGYFKADRILTTDHSPSAFWRDFRESIAYIRATPIVLAIVLSLIGWSSGGGAAQVLFTLYGEQVFNRGPAGIGIIWSAAGFGLVAGGILAHRLGPRLGFSGYKNAISIGYVVHGLAYVLFAIMPTIALASLFVGISRIAMGSNNVLNRTMLLTHVPDRLRGRVFATSEMVLNVAMTASLTIASIASTTVPIRTIGVIAGCLSASTAIFWFWADKAGKLREPALETVEAQDDYESPVVKA